jgi:hypothetical protein
VKTCQLSLPDEKLWKRIWWTLFTRDRSLSVALGRPVGFNLTDSDVGILTAEDFVEDNGGPSTEYTPDPTEVQFFLQYIKVCKSMGLILSGHYSMATQAHHIDTSHLASSLTLADWLMGCPQRVRWHASRHNFWAAVLHIYYLFVFALH